LADTFKVLGQAAPNPNTLTDLYTVTGSKQATSSSITICNQNSVAVKVRLSVAISGVADARKQYIYYDLPIAANDTFVATIGITLAKTDVVRCQTNTANVSFNLFGVEVV
jgi:hypothetical protein